MSCPALLLSRVSKRFTPRFSFARLAATGSTAAGTVTALNDISFSIPAGTRVALLGPNGAGKTTVLKLLATLLLPDTGSVRVLGLDAVKQEHNIKRRIGFCSCDERSFYWRLSGRQNLDFFARLHGLNARESFRRINQLCSIFEVKYADRRFDSYSSGMKQLIGLMRALLHDPDILLLDEPFKGLDHDAAGRIRGRIREGCGRRTPHTVVFTTHQLTETQDFADRFLVLGSGSALASGTLDELRSTTGLSAAHGIADVYQAVIAQHKEH